MLKSPVLLQSDRASKKLGLKVRGPSMYMVGTKSQCVSSYGFQMVNTPPLSVTWMNLESGFSTMQETLLLIALMLDHALFRTPSYLSLRADHPCFL